MVFYFWGLQTLFVYGIIKKRKTDMKNDDILFRCYDVISVESGNSIGRFKKRYDAEQAVLWLNTASGSELIRLKPVAVTLEDLEEYLKLYKAGVCYKSSEDFINEFKRILSQMSKSYKLKDENKQAFVKIKNFWWKLGLSKPLDKATVYNYSGGHMSEVDCTNLEIAEAEDWQNLDWSGTVLCDNSYKTGWLSPDGVFTGCDYRCHFMCALMVLKQPDSALEEQGYIKITQAMDRNELSAIIPYCIKSSYPKPTKSQLDFLAGLEIRHINHFLKEYYDELEL